MVLGYCYGKPADFSRTRAHQNVAADIYIENCISISLYYTFTHTHTHTHTQLLVSWPPLLQLHEAEWTIAKQNLCR